MEWHIEVVGSTRLRTKDGTSIPLTRTQRRLLARLALAGGDTVAVPSLMRAVWDGDPPTNARAALQNQISRIRGAADPNLITTHPAGYRLHAQVDVVEVVDAVEHAEQALAHKDHQRAFDAADRACRIVADDAYADLGSHPKARTKRDVLATVHLVAEDLRVEAARGLGRTRWALIEAQRLAAAAPYDAGRAIRLAQLLDRNGRRGDALAALANHARGVRMELGIAPAAEVGREQARLLETSDPRVFDRRRPFVGREGTLRQIIDVIEDGSSVWVWGEPGIGVSRCLIELRARLVDHGFAVALTSCAVHAGAPGDPLLDLVDDLGLQPDLTRGVIGAFLDAVRGRATNRPVVLLVDDWHQTGPSSRAALRDVAALPGVSVVAGSHLAPPTGEGVAVELDGLHDDAIAELLDSHPVPNVDAAELQRLTAGNPLLIEVMLAAPSPASGAITDAPDRATVPMLDRVLSALTDELSRRERDLLDIAAVAGDLAPRELVIDAWAGNEELHWPDTMVEERDGLVRFRHPTLQRAIYHRIPAGRRAEIHHALGSAAQRHGLQATTVASHLVEAATLDPAGAYAAARRAGEGATRAGAHRDAAAWFERAADICGTDPARRRDRLVAQIARGDALRLAGDPAHGDLLIAAVEEAIGLDDQHLVADAAYALLQLGATTDVNGPEPRVQRVMDAALASAPAELAVPLRASASLAWSLTQSATTSRTLFAAAERDAVTSTVRRRTLPFAYMALGMPGDLDEREQIGRELRSLGRDADDPIASFEAHHLLFSCGLQRGDGREVRRSLAAMSDLVDRVGDVGRRWQLLYQRATIAHLEGEHPACEQLSADGLTMFQSISPKRAMAAYFGQILILRITQGRVAELVDVLRGLITDQPGIPAWHGALALSLAATGDRDDARAASEHIRLARTLAQPDVTWLACHLIAGRAAALVVDEEAARLLIGDLAPWAGRGCWQGTCSYGPVDTVLGLLHRALGDQDAAGRHLAAATTFAERLGATIFLDELTRLQMREDVHDNPLGEPAS